MPTTETDWRESPTAWFAVMDRAVRDGDHERAAEAQRELARLGVTVRWARPSAKQRKAQKSADLDRALHWPPGTAAQVQLVGAGPLELVMFGARAAVDGKAVASGK